MLKLLREWATFVSRAAIEEDYPRQLLVILGLVREGLVLAGASSKDLDRAGLGLAVILRDVEEMLGDLQLPCGSGELRARGFM